jgi:hypothetical protein
VRDGAIQICHVGTIDHAADATLPILDAPKPRSSSESINTSI